ncbi:unnamed protein product [Dicrocoelium dendriticum]|nr:unnamed protein product [Dicrocoelium dendriticum]
MTKENKALHENIETLKIQRCTLLREQESLASKSSAVAKILKKKLRRKREYSNYLEEVYNSNRKWASKTVNCLSEIHKLVLILLSDRPGSMVAKKSVNCTPEVIQLILTHLTSILEESNEHDFQTREKIIPLRESIGDDRDSSKYNSETDESSGISQPHSSRAEDSELEISEPEMDSNDKRKRSFPCQSQRAASSTSLRTKNHTTMPCSSLSPQKFPELWDVMAGPKLQQFSPHSRRWCGALEKLRALLHTPSRKSYSSDTRYRIKPGDLKIIPSPSSIIPTNTAKMDTLRRCQTKLPHILPASVAKTQP